MNSANRGAVFQQIGRLYRDGTLSGLTDAQLLERYLTHGDEAAFESLVKLHGPMVLGVCSRVLRDPRDVEDAFQATFLILVRKAPTIRDRGLLSNWLYGVAYRVARRARTVTLRRRGREVAVANLEAMAAQEPADILGMGSVLDQELNRLPRKYRSPLILCYLDGRTHDQAAEELGCPVGTIRSRLARGRDLLRRRLTTRGHAPTAAILAAEAGLPTKLVTQAVPSSLVSTTVKAGLGLCASKTIQAGAVSVSALALTQGVLTTMKLAQLKMLGMAVLATSLSAGGVIAVSCAAGRDRNGSPDADGVVVNAAEPQEKPDSQKAKVAVPRGAISDEQLKAVESRSAALRPARLRDATSDERLKAVERKLDELLSRSIPPAARTRDAGSKSANPVGRDPFSALDDDDARSPFEPERRSIPELEVELKLALEDDERTRRLFGEGKITVSEHEQARRKVLLIKARLEGRYDALGDEVDRVKLEVNTKRAYREKTNAQTEVALSVVARNNRLNKRKPGMVSAEDVAKGEWEMTAASAQVAIVDAEIAELNLRVQQLERHRAWIRQIVKLGERVK